jgi:hypothetical protein
MKIKKMNKFVSFFIGKGVEGITLAPFGIYLIETEMNNHITIIHETIHWKQQMEMLIIPFYIWYLLEWVLKMFSYGGTAYYTISFEREAYTNQENKNYLITRKHYSWWKYLRIK